MNITMWLYAVDVADSLKFFFGWMVIVSGIIGGLTLMCSMGMVDDRDTTDKHWFWWRCWLGGAMTIFVISWFNFILIPREKTLYLMMGARTAEEIVLNPKVRETGGKVMDLINKKLEAALAGEEQKKEEKK
jgi:xanthine/uracil permease